MQLPNNIPQNKPAVKAFENTARLPAGENKIDAQAQQKKQLNASILEANLTVSLSAQNDPLALVYKTAIEEINKVLESEFGENAIQSAYESGLDVSPEATADRIVSLSTGFFAAFQESNPGLSEAEAAERFVDVIGGGIDKGFAEAREILESLQVLEGEIEANVDKTYDLVQDGLNAFLEQFSVVKDQSEEA